MDLLIIDSTTTPTTDGVDLLIVDSITSLVAPHLGGKGNYAGQAYMGHLVSSFHRLASCCVGVIVTNEARGDEDLALLQRGTYNKILV